MSATSTSFFQASRAPVAFAREKEHSGRHNQEGRRGKCSDALNLGREVRGCSVGCMLGMPEISPFVFTATATRYIGFLELKKCFIKRGVSGVADVSGVLMHEIDIFFPLHLTPV